MTDEQKDSLYDAIEAQKDAKLTTADEVRSIVERMSALFHDNNLFDDSVHEWRDHLYIAVLKSIAEGHATDPVEMTKAALEAEKIEFGRWYV